MHTETSCTEVVCFKLYLFHYFTWTNKYQNFPTSTGYRFVRISKDAFTLKPKYKLLT